MLRTKSLPCNFKPPMSFCMTTSETTSAVRSILHILQLTVETKGKMKTVRKTEGVCSAWVFPVGHCRPDLIAGTTQPQKSKILMSEALSEVRLDLHLFWFMSKGGNSFSEFTQPNSPHTVVPAKTWPSRRKGVVNKFERIPSFDLWFIFTTGKVSWYPFQCLLDATWCHKLVEMAEYALIIPEDSSLLIFEFLQKIPKVSCLPFLLQYQLPRHLRWSCHSYLLIQRCVFMPCSGEETVLLSSELFSYFEISGSSSSSDQISEDLLMFTRDTDVQPVQTL